MHLCIISEIVSEIDYKALRAFRQACLAVEACAVSLSHLATVTLAFRGSQT